MKKLMILCFALLFSVLSILSCVNFAYDGTERIEAEKQRITITKPAEVTNKEFLEQINSALSAIDADIMYAVTPQTPYIMSIFDDALDQQFQMLLLYGTQTLLLSIGLACLVLFSAKLYCENYRKKIASLLIEGYPLLSCMKPHLVVIAVSFVLIMMATSFAETTMQVSMNNWIVVVATGIEIIGALVVAGKYTRAKLSEIVKGAE